MTQPPRPDLSGSGEWRPRRRFSSAVLTLGALAAAVHSAGSETPVVGASIAAAAVAISWLPVPTIDGATLRSTSALVLMAPVGIPELVHGLFLFFPCFLAVVGVGYFVAYAAHALGDEFVAWRGSRPLPQPPPRGPAPRWVSWAAIGTAALGASEVLLWRDRALLAPEGGGVFVALLSLTLLLVSTVCAWRHGRPRLDGTDRPTVRAFATVGALTVSACPITALVLILSAYAAVLQSVVRGL